MAALGPAKIVGPRDTIDAAHPVTEYDRLVAKGLSPQLAFFTVLHWTKHKISNEDLTTLVQDRRALLIQDFNKELLPLLQDKTNAWMLRYIDVYHHPYQHRAVDMDWHMAAIAHAAFLHAVSFPGTVCATNVPARERQATAHLFEGEGGKGGEEAPEHLEHP